MKKLANAIKELGKDYILDLDKIDIEGLVKKAKRDLEIVAFILYTGLMII